MLSWSFPTGYTVPARPCEVGKASKTLWKPPEFKDTVHCKFCCPPHSQRPRESSRNECIPSRISARKSPNQDYQQLQTNMQAPTATVGRRRKLSKVNASPILMNRSVFPWHLICPCYICTDHAEFDYGIASRNEGIQRRCVATGSSLYWKLI